MLGKHKRILLTISIVTLLFIGSGLAQSIDAQLSHFQTSESNSLILNEEYRLLFTEKQYSTIERLSTMILDAVQNGIRANDVLAIVKNASDMDTISTMLLSLLHEEYSSKDFIDRQIIISILDQHLRGITTDLLSLQLLNNYTIAKDAGIQETINQIENDVDAASYLVQAQSLTLTDIKAEVFMFLKEYFIYNDKAIHYCEECKQPAQYEIVGLTGSLEYYCKSHYHELMSYNHIIMQEE